MLIGMIVIHKILVPFGIKFYVVRSPLGMRKKEHEYKTTEKVLYQTGKKQCILNMWLPNLMIHAFHNNQLTIYLKPTLTK